MSKQVKEKGSVINTILTVVGIVLCVILVPIIIINCTLIIKSYTGKSEVPSFGGIFPLVVLTDSMNPLFESGDMIVCSTIDAESVKEGDVIACFDPAGNGTSVITHRVVEVTNKDGTLAFRTKGDANNTEDAALIPAEKLIGVYKFCVAGFGNVALFMSTSWGLLVCVIIPLVLLIIYDFIRRRIYEKNRNKNTKELLAELEALRLKNGMPSETLVEEDDKETTEKE